MRLKDMSCWLREIKASYPVTGVAFFGGEPLLYFDLLLNLITEARAQGIHDRDIITNGFWGEDEARASRYAKGLKDAGLTQMVISADAFHEEFVSLDAVRGAIRAAKEARVGRIKISAKSLGETHIDNPFHQRTKQILRELSSEFDVDEVAIGPIMMIGRAADELARYLPHGAMREGKCAKVASLTAESPSYIEIDPDGWVLTCCPGIAIGKAGQKSVSDIVREYDHRKHAILSVLLKEGGEGLLRLAASKGFNPSGRYASTCHLCFAARRFLRPEYPEILAPDCFYE